MDYKKIIKNQNTRLKILGLTEFIPDKKMLKFQYKIKTGNKLNLKNPSRFTEKLQWYKLNYRDPLLTICADKYKVRKYVESKNLGEILIPLLGVYKNAKDIDFNNLPNKFILKTTNGSHTNIICEDKSKLNIKDTIETLNSWLVERTVKAGREWAYYDIEPRIIIEELLEKDHDDDIIDYKFYGFCGSVNFVKVVANRFNDEGQIQGIFDNNFKQLPYFKDGVRKITDERKRPKNFDKMVYIAKILSKDFPHTRVDLYNIDGKIYFGELTFYDTSGYETFTPDEFDYILGKEFKLPLV